MGVPGLLPGQGGLPRGYKGKESRRRIEVSEWEFQDYLPGQRGLTMQIFKFSHFYIIFLYLLFKISPQVTFGMPDKKFGPAEDEAEKSWMPKKILKLTEEFSLPAGADPRCFKNYLFVY